MKRPLAALLAPLLILGQALPAAAQVQAARAAGEAASFRGGFVAPVSVAAPALGTLSAPSLSAPAPMAVPSLAAPAASFAPAFAAAAEMSPAPSILPAAVPAAAPAAAPALTLGVTVDGTPAASASVPAAAPREGVVARLAKAVNAGVASLASALFDGAAPAPELVPVRARGIIAKPVDEHRLPKGVGLDAKPQPSDKGSVRVNDFHLAPDHSLPNGASPIVLNADASDPAAVEKALRDLVDSNPAKYGAASADMAKVHVQLVPGDKVQGQADTYYAIFRQWKRGVDHDGQPYYLLVDGGSLTFVLKVFSDGKPTVMATEGRLYPGVDASIMKVNYSDDELLAKAAARLRTPADPMPSSKFKRVLSRVWERVKAAARAAARTKKPAPPVFLTREITQIDGTWRALNLYQAADLQGRPVIASVDVNTGEAFAWSAQELLRDAASIEGTATARGTTLTDAGSDHGPTGALPLPFATVYDDSGKAVATTGADGSFTVPGDGKAWVKLTVRLQGAYATQSDDDGAQNGSLETTFTAVPGQTARVTLNPNGDSEELAADVNGYVYYSRQVDWLKNSAGVADERILAPLAGGVKSNRHDMPGNAYYSPADDSLNLQASATVTVKDRQGKPHQLQFENTAQPSIIYHESTHRAVQILSQIALTAEQAASAAYRFVARVMDPVMDGGVNEAIADTVSMYMRGSPLIGEGFYANMPAGPKNLIRTGENTTAYDPKNPDPHAQGEAYMGFTWTVRQGLIAALGEAAGAAYAALLVVPTTLYSQPQDVPTAMLHVLIGDMKTDGTIPHEAMIRAAAKAHGPDLPSVSR